MEDEVTDVFVVDEAEERLGIEVFVLYAEKQDLIPGYSSFILIRKAFMSGRVTWNMRGE